jgi:MFS superfamily sulfate permease-like transporter
MFNWRFPLELWKVSKIDLIPWGISFFGCTFWDIEIGVGAGAAVNILILIFFMARPEHEVLWGDRKAKSVRLESVTDDSASSGGATSNGENP